MPNLYSVGHSLLCFLCQLLSDLVHDQVAKRVRLGVGSMMLNHVDERK